MAFLYGLFLIDEPQPHSTIQPKRSFLVDFFDPSNAIQTFKITTKKGLKLQISMLLLVVIVVVGPMHGEQAVLYLYTRYKFGWGQMDFSFYSTYSALMSMGGEF